METKILAVRLLATILTIVEASSAMQFPKIRFAPRIQFLPELMPADEPVDPWDDIRDNCHKKCPYGLETDVEGRPMCACRDPCESVRCMDGFQCVPEKTTECVEGFCRYEATCKDVDICELPKPTPSETDICDEKSRRYFYDAKRKKCRKFVGCGLVFGNNFARRKDCKRECIKRPLRKLLKKLIKHRTHKSSKIDRATRRRLQKASKYNVDLSRLLPRKFLCPETSPHAAMCNVNPCARCTNSKFICIPTFCGKCSAIFVNKRSGYVSHTCPLD